jgi:streptogramin lyase
MKRILVFCLAALSVTLTACTSEAQGRPSTWSAPEVLVAPSSFAGVHGLAVDAKGRLLAGSVVGNAIWEVDRQTGATSVFIGGPEGQADDIAIGRNGELAWTNYLFGTVRYRESDTAPIRVVLEGLPGLNSLDFDRRNNKLYVSQVFQGDAVWEVDVTGANPPRRITQEAIGGFNGFEVGPDGMLYGPLWFKGQVVQLNPGDGSISRVINSQFTRPAAANLDGKGNLWVVDTTEGTLNKVELSTGQKTVVKTLKTAIDNLAIAPDGTIYVANMADNSVEAFNPATGELRMLTSGKLAVPGGMKLAGDTLWVADIFTFREVNLKTGEVRDVARMQASDLEYPFAVGLSSSRIALTSWFTGTVQLFDRATQKTQPPIHDLKVPMDAIPMDDGTVLVAEFATGTVRRLSGADFKQSTVVAEGLIGPVQMVLGRDGAVYVTEAGGSLTRINLDDGSKSTVASELALPEGLAQTPWGSFIVAEAGARRLTEIDPKDGSRRSVAENLEIGLVAGPGLPPPYVPTGVVVSANGTVYFSADRNNAIYRIQPRR